MKSLPSPTSEMPDRSPLISAANTGTPARAKPSAITCNDTVLPVPVAPVTRPCRLASASVSQAVCSPLPIKIFSSVSAVLLSEVAIRSPLRVCPGAMVAVRHNHIVSTPSIETVGRYRRNLSPFSQRISYFFQLQWKNGWRGATNRRESDAHSCIAATLATRSQTKIASVCADRLYFAKQTLKIILQASDPVKPAEGGAIWTN